MPRKRVEPVKILHHGNVRWYINVPKELRNENTVKRRFFDRQEDAADFARDLEKQRQGSFSEFFTLSAIDQAALLRAAKMLKDRISEVEQAVTVHVKSTHIKPSTIAEAMNECLTAKRLQDIAPNSLRVLRSTVRRFGWHFPDDKQMSSITQDDVVNWLGSMTNISPATRRTYLIDLNTFFQWCVDSGFLAEHPAKGLKPPRYIKREPRVLSVEHCQALMDAALAVEPGLIPYLSLCLFAGIRPEEARWLKWENVKDKFIEVPAEISKTRVRRLVEIHPNLKKWLALKGDLPVINIARRMLRVRALAKVPWRQDCLRHTFASYSCAIYGCMKTAQQCGNSETILQQHYLETCEKKQAKRFFSIVPPKPKQPRKHETTSHNGRARNGVRHVAGDNESASHRL